MADMIDKQLTLFAVAASFLIAAKYPKPIFVRSYEKRIRTSLLQGCASLLWAYCPCGAGTRSTIGFRLNMSQRGVEP